MPIRPVINKRLIREAAKLKNFRDPFISYTPVSDNLQTWHFTVRGPPDTPFENGVFHGAIYLYDVYPFKPPSVEFFTRNGKYHTNTPICICMSKYNTGQHQVNFDSTNFSNRHVIDSRDDIIFDQSFNSADEIVPFEIGHDPFNPIDDQGISPLWLYDDHNPRFQVDNPEQTSSSHRVCIIQCDEWSPSITIGSLVRMIQISFEDTDSNRIGLLESRPSDDEIRQIATESVRYCCRKCGNIINHLAPCDE